MPRRRLALIYFMRSTRIERVKHSRSIRTMYKMPYYVQVPGIGTHTNTHALRAHANIYVVRSDLRGGRRLARLLDKTGPPPPPGDRRQGDYAEYSNISVGKLCASRPLCFHHTARARYFALRRCYQYYYWLVDNARGPV